MHIIGQHKKRTTTYGIGNPGPGLRQAHKCGGVKHVVLKYNAHCK
jgi:hypothetical protein